MEFHALNTADLVGRSLSCSSDSVCSLCPEELAAASLPATLSRQASETPDQIFVESPAQTVTYSEAEKIVADLAQQLRRDFKAGTKARVAIALNNSTEYVLSLLGVMAAGLVAVPIPPDMEMNRLKRVLSKAGIRLVLTSSAWAGKFRTRISKSDIAWSLEFDPEPANIPDDLAAIFFTSGSTGEPKGVMLTHTNLSSNAASIAEYLELSSTDRGAVVVPFYHALGNSVLTSHLHAGATVLTGTSIMFPETLLDQIDSHSITNLAGVPEVFHRLIGHSTLKQRTLKSLRFMSVAGGSLNVQTVEQMRQAIEPAQFFVMYGQTEATARLAWLPPDALEMKLGSIGRAVPGVTLEVVDDRGFVVKTGQMGELRATGPNISPGYWNDLKSTSRIFKDGWLYTTDCGTIDEDGFVFLTGRQNSFLKRFGFRMHPAEVDEFLTSRVSLGQFITVSFSREGEPGLAVFAQPARGDSLCQEELMRLCASQLPKYKQPDYLEIVDEFPLNDAMKIDYQALRQRARKCA